MNIPIVSMIDSNIDNSNHIYSLFGNDDSLESLDFFLKTLELGFKEGQVKEKKTFYYYFLKKLKNNKKLLSEYKKTKK
jgi:ribosomal protein S2